MFRANHVPALTAGSQSVWSGLSPSRATFCRLFAGMSDDRLMKILSLLIGRPAHEAAEAMKERLDGHVQEWGEAADQYRGHVHEGF